MMLPVCMWNTFPHYAYHFTDEILSYNAMLDPNSFIVMLLLDVMT